MKGHLNYKPAVGLLLFLIGAAVLSCETESSVDPVFKDYFIKYYGGDGNQVARDFVVNADGTIVMAGNWIEPIEAEPKKTRVYLVKADAEGNTIWSRKLGTDRESVRDIDVFSSGPFQNHYMVLTNCRRLTNDSTDVKVLIVNQEGVAVDSSVFSLAAPLHGYLMTSYGHSITPLSDGGYVIAGNIDSASLILDGPDGTYEDVKDNLSVRYDQNLNLLNLAGWTTSFGGESFAMGIKIFESSNPTYPFYYAGYSDEKQPEDELLDKNMVFVRLTNSGGAAPPVLYSGASRSVSEIMNAVVKTSNGLYIAVGTEVDGSERKIYASIVNGSFNQVVRDGALDGDTPTTADGIAVADSRNSGTFWVLANEVRTGGKDIWVGKVNQSLTVVNSFSFGGTNNDDTGSAIQELPNGDLLILGTMELVNQRKMALIKVKPNGGFK